MTNPGETQSRWHTAGYSLIEMIIVLAIIGLVMAAMLQSMLGIRQYASTAEVQDDLNIEAQRILAIIREDIGASGWYLPVGEPAPGIVNDRANLFFPYIQVQQTGKLGTRFPHHDRLAFGALTGTDVVNLQHYPGLPGSVADKDAVVLDPAVYRTSFYARSQEIIFLKVLKGSFNPNGVQPILEPIDFGEHGGATYASPNQHVALGIRTMSQWDRGTTWEVDVNDPLKGRWYIPSGAVRTYDADASGIWLRPVSGATGMSMPLRWESMTRFPRLVSSGGSPSYIDIRELREYSYAVLPNPAADIPGRGQLVRAYKKPSSDITDSAGNPTPGVNASERTISFGDYQPDVSLAAMPSTMVVDRVISDKVDRITFDTFRTDQMPNPNFPANSTAAFVSGLEINQIRVRLFLSKRGTVDIGAPQRLVVEATFSMRSTTDTNAINDLAQQLGAGGTVIIH